MSEPILIWGAGAIGGILGAYLARAGHAVHMVDIVGRACRTRCAATACRIEGPVEDVQAGAAGQHAGRAAGAVSRDHSSPSRRTIPRPRSTCWCRISRRRLRRLGPERAERARHRRSGSGRRTRSGCFVNYGADWLEPGRILYGNRAAVAVGELDGRLDRPRRARSTRCCRMVEPDAVLTDNIWGYLWGKMGYGALLFATALTPTVDVRRHGAARAPRRLPRAGARGDAPCRRRGRAARWGSTASIPTHS